ncbi:MAG: helix-turn-helix transcriptional regulator [Eubacteriales bacterium]
MPNVQLAKNLYTMRKLNHLTQDFVSDYLSISRQAYSNYETTKRTPDIDSLVRLSDLYNISLDQLVNHNLGGVIAEQTGPYAPGLNIMTGDTIYLSEEEINLIINFRDLTLENRKILNGFFQSLDYTKK